MTTLNAKTALVTLDGGMDGAVAVIGDEVRDAGKPVDTTGYLLTSPANVRLV